MDEEFEVTIDVIARLLKLGTAFEISVTALRGSHRSRVQRTRRWLGDTRARFSTLRAKLLDHFTATLRTVDALCGVQVDIRDAIAKGERSALSELGDAAREFQRLLGSHRVSYRQSLINAQSSLTTIAANVNLSRMQQDWKSVGSESSIWYSHAKVLKRETKHLTEHIIANLQAAVEQLHQLSRATAEEDTSETSPRTLATYLKKLRLLRSGARNLFTGISLPELWSCECSTSHNLLLRLEVPAHTRPANKVRRIAVPRDGKSNVQRYEYFIHAFDISYEDVEIDAGYAENRQIGIRLECRSSIHERNLVKRNVDAVAPNLIHGTLPVRSGRVTEMPGLAKIQSEKRVRFSTSTPVSGNSPDNPQIEDDTSEATEITNICDFFRKTDHCQRKYHSYVQDGTSSPAWHRRHAFRHVGSGDTKGYLLTLQSTVCQINYHNRQDELSPTWVFSDQQRLVMAATLASNIFQLYGNWIKKHWSIRDFLVPVDSLGQKALTHEMQCVVRFDIADLGEANAQTGSSVWRGNFTSDESLLEPLGNALCELLAGREICGMPGSDPRYLEKAFKYLCERYGRGEGSIANAVRECFFWSGPVNNGGFDDETFSAAVFEKILWPLLFASDASQGRLLPGALEGGRVYGTTKIEGHGKAVMGDVMGNLHYHTHHHHSAHKPSTFTQLTE